MIDIQLSRLISECRLKAVLSGGKGGQHANKVATKVELYFDISTSACLTDLQREVLLVRLKSKLSNDGILKLSSSSERSQFRNRKMVIDKFVAIISTALVEKKKRKKTNIPKISNEQRLQKKRLKAEVKKLRQKPEGY
jgi:ribosome-associated protein